MNIENKDNRILLLREMIETYKKYNTPKWNNYYSDKVTSKYLWNQEVIQLLQHYMKKEK